MKVLQINATYSNGSTGTIVKDIQELCIKEGIECKVAYAISHTPKHLIDGFHIGNLLSNKLHALLCRINGKQGYFSYLSTINLIRQIDKYKPDVINIHNLHSNFINLNLLLSAIAKRDIALVATLHDCWFFTGGCFHFTHAKCDKWLSDCYKCPKKRQDTPAYLFDCAKKILKDRYKYFSKIKRLHLVGVSNWSTFLAKKTVFKQAISCQTIYNGIDFSVFKPTKSDLKSKLGLDNKLIILGPASKWLDPINDDLLQATINSLTEKHALLLYGFNGKDKISLPHVQTYGFTSSKHELAELYSIADIFVNCSREDTLSLINIEAQACGTPLLTYDNTGLRETVHPQFGKCIKTGDVSSMIKEILCSSIKEESVSQEIVQWISNRFNKDANYKKYIDLYHKAANKRS